MCFFFFFKQKTAYEMRISDWSSRRVLFRSAAAIPWAVTSVYLTEARVRHRHAATVAITLALSAAILIPALVVVPDHGLAGASWAFLGGNAAAAVVALGAHISGRATSDDDVVGHTAPDVLEPEDRSEERRVGQACGRTCRSRLRPCTKKK